MDTVCSKCGHKIVKIDESAFIGSKCDNCKGVIYLVDPSPITGDLISFVE